MEKALTQALKKKVRFPSRLGTLTLEDLFDLDFKMLDEVYRELSSLDAATGEGLLADTADSDANLRKTLVKYVFELKRTEADKAEAAANRRARKEKLLEVIEEKQEGELKSKEIDELKAMLEDLDS